eukprot:2983575-Ditylum_brightwellii.AAC.1
MMMTALPGWLTGGRHWEYGLVDDNMKHTKSEEEEEEEEEVNQDVKEEYERKAFCYYCCIFFGK